MSLSVKLKDFYSFYNEDKFQNLEEQLKKAHSDLYTGQGKGSDFLGWVNLPTNYDKAEFEKIKAAAEKIRKQSEVLVVIGIGGSYLGARSAIEFLHSPNYNVKPKDGCPQIFFVGNNISSEHIAEIIDIIGDRDFSVNVISKSGTTTEPALAFHFFEELLKEKYNDDYKDRLYITTDAARGTLRPYANKLGCETFVISDDIGGRYSVLTAVGLLPIAVSGANIDDIMSGAYDMQKSLETVGFENPAWQYAAARNLAYADGKIIEILGCYEPKFRFMAEWWKQLFGESEGKDKKGIFPASQDLTADLHSLGQFIQDGTRALFETIVDIENPNKILTVENHNADFANLEIFEGKTLEFVNKKAHEGTTKAHVAGSVPNITISLSDSSAKTYGEMIYFFEFACGLSAYVLGVNPFDQPGVEAYKKEMMALIK